MRLPSNFEIAWEHDKIEITECSSQMLNFDGALEREQIKHCDINRSFHLFKHLACHTHAWIMSPSPSLSITKMNNSHAYPPLSGNCCFENRLFPYPNYNNLSYILVSWVLVNYQLDNRESKTTIELRKSSTWLNLLYTLTQHVSQFDVFNKNENFDNYVMRNIQYAKVFKKRDWSRDSRHNIGHGSIRKEKCHKATEKTSQSYLGWRTNLESPKSSMTQQMAIFDLVPHLAHPPQAYTWESIYIRIYCVVAKNHYCVLQVIISSSHCTINNLYHRLLSDVHQTFFEGR